MLGTVVVIVFFASMAAWGNEIWDPGGAPTWKSTLALGTMYAAGWWGTLVYALATAHLFGGEYVDGTAEPMFTSPLRREGFIVAKFVVLAVWALGLTLVSVGSHAAVAVWQGASGFSWDLIATSLADNLFVALLFFLTTPVTAAIAMVGRGYMAPLLFATAVMTMGWACGFLGWTEWFPWAMPATVGGGLGPPDLLQAHLGVGSWALALGTFALGLAAVFLYVDRADTRP